MTEAQPGVTRGRGSGVDLVGHTVVETEQREQRESRQHVPDRMALNDVVLRVAERACHIGERECAGRSNQSDGGYAPGRSVRPLVDSRFQRFHPNEYRLGPDAAGIEDIES